MKETYFFECMDCGKEWEQKEDSKSFEKALSKGDFSKVGENGVCPRCGSGDIVISKEDGTVFDGEVFEAKESKLKVIIKNNSEREILQNDVKKKIKDLARTIKGIRDNLSPKDIEQIMVTLKKELY